MRNRLVSEDVYGLENGDSRALGEDVLVLNGECVDNLNGVALRDLLLGNDVFGR